MADTGGKDTTKGSNEDVTSNPSCSKHQISLYF